MPNVTLQNLFNRIARLQKIAFYSLLVIDSGFLIIVVSAGQALYPPHSSVIILITMPFIALNLLIGGASFFFNYKNLLVLNFGAYFISSFLLFDFSILNLSEIISQLIMHQIFLMVVGVFLLEFIPYAITISVVSIANIIHYFLSLSHSSINYIDLQAPGILATVVISWAFFIYVAKQINDVRLFGDKTMTKLSIENEALSDEIMQHSTMIQEQERKLAQLYKFEVLGTLAGGIAHDFNNTLMGIGGKTSLLMEQYKYEPNLMMHLKTIHHFAQNSSQRIKQLLNFAQGTEHYDKQIIDVNKSIQEIAALFQATHSNMECEFSLSKNICKVEIDQAQFENVILNLLVNAADSMDDKGTVIIQTGFTTLKQNNEYKLQSGRYLSISVEDFGKGIKESDQQYIFEPFFTSKHKNKGVGLGLASAQMIINAHSGKITFTSQYLSGTKFTILLPCVAEDRSVQEVVGITREYKCHQKHILVIDDDITVRDTIIEMLEFLGHIIFASWDLESSLEMCEQHNNSFDMVILDLVLPGTDTLDLLQQLKRKLPQAKFVLSSGTSSSQQAHQVMNAGCDSLLEKPYTLTELKQVLEVIFSEKLG